MKKILLFDIDGTLIHINSTLMDLHNGAFSYGFKEVYMIDVSKEELVGKYPGTTDKYIVKDILRKKGLNEKDISVHMDDMFKAMVGNFHEKVMLRKEYKEDLIEGVAESLKRLDRNKDCIIGLLTANVKEIARMKLEALGIWNYFKIGAFGDSSEIRSELVNMAVKDAINKRLISRREMKEVYVIGDTKNDIACAKENGAVSVSVATGRISKAELEACSPDYSLGNLRELANILQQQNPVSTRIG